MIDRCCCCCCCCDAVYFLEKEEDDDDTLTFKSNNTQQSTSTANTTIKIMVKKILSSIPLLGLTFAIVQISNKVESYVGKQWWGVPGTACAVISIIAPLINSFFNNNNSSSSKRTTITSTRGYYYRSWWDILSQTANPLAEFLFLTFFASIGIGVNLEKVLHMGPSCIVFSSLALSIHLFIALFGSSMISSLIRRILQSSRKKDCGGSSSSSSSSSNSSPEELIVVGYELEDVWIASNALIGGPATAAAFVCNQMKDRRSQSKLLRGRTMAATVFGVIGYAIGTIIGTSMYQLVGGVFVK